MCELLEKISSDPVVFRGRGKKREPTPSMYATTSQVVTKKTGNAPLEESEDLSELDDLVHSNENNQKSINSNDQEQSPVASRGRDKKRANTINFRNN